MSDEPRLAASPAAPVLRGLVGGGAFTVVSNNCWGAHIYQRLGLPYATPFVGLFIPPKSYLRLIEEFDELIGSDLEFVASSEAPSVNAWRQGAGLDYPIGLLGGRVEINFQHYASEAEAVQKWRRRVARMVPDRARTFFKFDDREGATTDDIVAFCGAPQPHKVCFTAAPHGCRTVVVPAAPGEVHVPDGVSLANLSRRYFNTLRWVSSRPAWLPLPSLV